MSVASTVSIQPRMWRGYDDPGLPVGAYIAHTVALGDATGGNNTLTFTFKLAGEPISGRFFSVEQLNAFTTQDVTADGSFQVINFERVATFMIGQRVWSMLLERDGITSAAFARHDLAIPQPLFLGQTSRVLSEPSQVVMVSANVNIVAFSGVIQGYIWEPRSVMAPGGLRRPIDGVYG